MKLENVEDIYQLTPLQKGMLFETLYAPNSGVYVEQLSMTLSGPLDIAAFRRAWEQVIARHPALRTAFFWDGLDEPLQVVRQQTDLTWRKQDWRHLSKTEQTDQLTAFLEADRERGFALDQAPLMRFTLIEIAAETHHFIWSYHHLLLDGWCLPTLFKEIFTLYQAASHNHRLSLSQPRPYRDYLYWLQQQDIAEAETFWRDALRGFTSPTPLTVNKRPFSETLRYAKKVVPLSPTTYAALQTQARQHRLTLNTLFQGAWALLMSRYRGEAEVLFGVTVAGRPADLPGVEEIVGLFINTLPVRIHVPGEGSVLSWLQQVQAQQRRQEAYAYTVLTDIQRWSETPPGQPMFDTLFVFENYPVDKELSGSLNGLQIENVQIFEQTNYPLTVTVVSGSELTIQFSYDPGRFETEKIDRMAGHLQQILAGIVENITQPLSQISLLTAAEQRQQLVEWNDTQVIYPSSMDKCVHQLFEDQVERTPKAIAVVSDGQSLTYDELNRRTNQLAHYLQSLNVGPETLVGLCTERSVEMVMGILAILKAGGAYVPLDPTLPKARLASMLEAAPIAVLLTRQHLLNQLPDHSGQTVCLDADWADIAQASVENPASTVSLDNLIYVIFTSGSTGIPKAAGVYHRGFMNLMQWYITEFGIEADDRVLLATSPSFDLTQKNFFAPLLVGGELHLLPTDYFDPKIARERIFTHQLTLFNCTPSVFYLLLDETADNSLAQLASLRYVFLGGEPISVARLQRWIDAPFFRTEIVNTYGPTECTDVCAFYRLPEPARFLQTAIPIGKPIANAKLLIVDDHLNLLPVGVAGELCVAGIGVGAGYINDSDLTQQKFVPNPFDAARATRLYRTGDLARYQPDGNIEFLGRMDYQVKIRGFRIELGEIEAVLNQHPNIQECAVVVREDQAEDKRLVAYMVSDQIAANSPPSSAVGDKTSLPPADDQYLVMELRRFLQTKLPDYMIPTAFMRLATLPLTPSGKVDRKALPRPERESTPDFIPPRTATEVALAVIWREVLGVEKVGLNDDFFVLGGHSLLATQIISRIRQTFQIELPLRSLFEYPNLAALANVITKAKQSTDFPIEHVSRTEALPLSFAQQRLWFLDQLEGPNPLYNMPAGLTFSGDLDISALARSLNHIVQRHEVLRTTFRMEAGEAKQIIQPEVTLTVPLIDLQHLPAETQAAEVQRLAEIEALQPFDLSCDLLLRSKLLWLGPEEFALLVTMHHIASDGWSIEVLIREVRRLYQAYTQGLSSPLPDLPIQYADFAYWQRQWLQGDRLTQQLTYWRQQLMDAPPLLPLPTDHPRPAQMSYRGQHRSFTLPSDLSQALQMLSRQAETTLFMTLLAAFKVLLYRYSGQSDLVVGSPIANRTRPELETLIGFFVNTLALRTDLSSQPTFLELLAQVKQITQEAYEHQDLPFEMVVEMMQPERNLSHTPLFQVMFVSQNIPTAELELPGVQVSRLFDEVPLAKFDLTLFVEDVKGNLVGTWEYNAALFEPETIERMTGHFQTLLTNLLDNPAQPITHASLLTAVERRQLLVEWTDTGTDYPADQGIAQLFEQQVERTPEAIAVTFADRHLTYRALNQQANQLAHYLQSLGVGPETTVGLCLERSLEMVIGLLGILKAGGAYVPLDPTYPHDRITFIVEDAQLSHILSHSTWVQKSHLTSDNGQPQFVCFDTALNVIRQQPTHNPRPRTTADNLAYVIYTSGSTGTPKGTAIPHRGVVRLVKNTNYAKLDEEEIFLQLAPISFDASTFEIWGALLNGARLVIGPPHLLSLAELSDLIAQHQITTLWLTAGLFHQLVDQDMSALSSLRQLLAGGDVLSPSHVEKAAKALEACQLINGYGPTENTTFTCCYTVTPAEQFKTSVPIGQPIANSHVYILDDALQPVPIGVVGELYIGGSGLGRSYFNRPGLTAERFIPDPFSGQVDKHSAKGGRLYKTGDRACYRPDGSIEFLGRLDNQVKLRGFRIELGEIEANLNKHPDVQESVVAVHKDSSSNKRLVAYVATAHHYSRSRDQFDNPILITELRHFLQTKLPDYMIPANFILLDTLPLTPNGKLDRRALTALKPQPAMTYDPPRTPTEETLAAIWRDALSIEQVGRHDNFFELGGHSLLATLVIARVREAFQIELPLRSLFEQPDIAGLADMVVRAKQALLPPITPVPRTEALPLSFAQQRLWFLDQLEGSSAAYNIPVALKLTGDLDISALSAGFNALVQRHEVLRTTFRNVAGEAKQIIHAQVTLSLPLIDLRHLPAEAQARQVERLAEAEALRPFDLEQDPMIRTRLLLLASNAYVLLVTMHHIASDGWSVGVLVPELTHLYQAYVQGLPSPLPALPIQYADFAAWQREWLQSGVLAEQLAFWQAQFAEPPSVLDLPTDHPRPSRQTHYGEHLSFSLPADLSRALQDLSLQNEATLFMTLLTAFNVLLYRYSGQTDIVVGSPIANRTRPEIEPLIGFFVNTLALRTNLANNPTFLDLLTQVKQTAQAAYEHQDLPFEVLVDALQPERNLSHSPLFQVMFSWQNIPQPPLEIPGLHLDGLEPAVSVAKFDLTLSMQEHEGNLIGSWVYNTGLFEADTIARLGNHFQNLLTAIVEHPTQSIAHLQLLTETERHRLLLEWNDVARDYPLDQCLHHLFEAHVASTPDSVAVVFGEQHLTYAELNTRADQLAHYLQQLRVVPETPVGLFVERSLELIIGLLGILKAGGAYLSLDPTYPAERLKFMLDDAQISIVLTQDSLTADLPVDQAQVICLDTGWDRIMQFASDQLTNTVTAANLAYIMYTSGSTGTPKAAMLSHQGVVNRLLWMREAFQMSPADAVMHKASLNFDASVWEIFLPLLSGARLVVAHPDESLDNAVLVRRIIEQHITILHFIPTLLQHFLETPGVTDCSPIRRVWCGGEVLPTDLQEKFFTQLKAELYNGYGPTEASINATYWHCQRRLNGQTVPIGRPLANYRIYLLDRHLEPVPVGVPGELYIGGVGVSRGYLNRPGLTATRFIPNPVSTIPGDRLYRTGDLARYQPDGVLQFLGRVDHQIKINGVRIELGEIEAVLRQHPEIKESVAIAQDVQPGRQRLVAYIVREPISEANSLDEGHQQFADDSSLITELRRFLQTKLPEYMVPTAIVVLPALPLTPNGKVDRRALPAPEQHAPADYVSPRTPTEMILAAIWAEVLRVKSVGVEDNFFDLGGHSLLATQVVSRIRHHFQIELPLRRLFEQPTIAALTESVTQARQADLPPIEPADRTQPLPLSFAQQRLWFLDQLEGANATYNIPIALKLTGPVNIPALAQALNAIVQRHEVLRTTFHNPAGQAQQIIHHQVSLALPLVDLQHLPTDRQEHLVITLAEAEALRPFDLSRDLMLRASLLILGQTEIVLLLTMHHIAADGWSSSVLIAEVTALYQAFCQEKISSLPTLPLQYADFAAWQHQLPAQQAVAEHLTYWQNRFAQPPPLLALPTDHPRPPQATYQGAHLSFTLPPELSQKLEALSHQQDATLFMSLLAAFKVLLFRYSGQTDLVVGSPIANRTRPELESLIGFFVNTLPFRSDLSGDPTFLVLLDHIKQTSQDAYEHQALPFEQLVDAVQPERHLSHSPLFQVMFVWQNVPQPALSLPDLEISPLTVQFPITKFDLTLTMEPTGQGLVGTWEYNTA
ncbi:MAG: amino acid adenylation domain-containing protein, partial [Anaerolineae bacterium]|nr:amino acid adenylation domain-containing protein [Anaerolineae bacterium]